MKGIQKRKIFGMSRAKRVRFTRRTFYPDKISPIFVVSGVLETQISH